MSLTKLTNKALETVRGRARDMALRVYDKYELPVLWQRYRKNTLTHGMDFLRGDEQIAIHCPLTRGLPPWRPIPGPGVPSLSKAKVIKTEEGHVLLRGEYSGLTSGLPLLRNDDDADVVDPEDEALWSGAVGMGSTARWKWDVSQHHWLEIRFRSDGRQYELVVQADPTYGDFKRFWRANVPRSPPPIVSRDSVGSGPYALLGLPRDATAEEIRESYMKLVKTVHPDTRGGSEERFKSVSKAYALLADVDKRERFDTEGPQPGDDVDADLQEMGEWCTIKLPFTAFKDRSFYQWEEKVGHLYFILSEEDSGPFALEVESITMGRCANGCLPAAGFFGKVGCEMGHCECGYYNGMRCEGFDGPLKGKAVAPGFEYGHALHHGEFE